MNRSLESSASAGREPSRESIEALISRIAHGDEAALSQFFDVTRRRVFGLALSILRQRTIAEEAALDVYTHVWRRARDYAPERGDPWTWLLTITRTRALDLARARMREAKRLDGSETAREVAAIQADLAAGISDSETARILRGALFELPETEREPILLAYYAGRTYAETAALLGLPEGTVKSRIRQGLGVLRRALARREGDLT